MRTCHGLVLAVVAGSVFAEEPMARLPWLGFSAGPVIRSQDSDSDVWALEDFSIDQATTVIAFEFRGWTHPDTDRIDDVSVRIYDGFPPDGANLIIESVAGTGSFRGNRFDNAFYRAEFEPEVLSGGSYFVAFTVHADTALPLAWATEAEHDIGGGVAQNALCWNPRGGNGWDNNVRAVPDDLKGNGQTGVNFILLGEAASCAADLDGDGDADADDFFAYLDGFEAGDLGVCDTDGDGDCDAEDFFGYLDLFAAGC